MNSTDLVELYVLKCASLKIALDQVLEKHVTVPARNRIERENMVAPFVAQFPMEVRKDAEDMAEYYKLFFMIENDMRRFIDENLAEIHGGPNWWNDKAPNSAKEEYKQNLQREQDAGVSARSDNPLDYISFGQLGEIMRANWDVFGGVLSNQKALGRVMFSLNMLRGPIAHCGLLAEDEVERLKLSVKDWFRLLEGPKA
jgi:hypothetical protein